MESVAGAVIQCLLYLAPFRRLEHLNGLGLI
jgi:hypothetical protein